MNKTQLMKLRKLLKTHFGENNDVGASYKNGWVYVRESYFYRHGRDADLFAESVRVELNNLVQVHSAKDCWNSWPKDSYFEVRLHCRDLDALQQFLSEENKS